MEQGKGMRCREGRRVSEGKREEGKEGKGKVRKTGKGGRDLEYGEGEWTEGMGCREGRVSEGTRKIKKRRGNEGKGEGEGRKNVKLQKGKEEILE